MKSLVRNHKCIVSVLLTLLIFIGTYSTGYTDITPVSDRTPQVRDAIVAAVPGVNNANDVTEAHLAAITNLDLSNESIAALKIGDFDGLSALTTLNLSSNDFRVSGFWGTSTTLPADIFDGLSALTTLRLNDNHLRSLPIGIFDGLSALTTLDLSGNPVNPLPIRLSLEKVADGQFKAVAHTGAPFDIVLPVNVEKGSISNGATTVTIPTGSRESETLTVTRDPGAFAFGSVSVAIGTLPAVPSGHRGYTLHKSNLWTVLDYITRLGNRTPQVRDAIIRATGVSDHTQITGAHLASIDSLQLSFAPTSNNRITTLKAGDFDGLIGLTRLNLSRNALTTLPAGIFDGLTALKILYLNNNAFTTLPAGIFDGLSELTRLYLYNNALTTLPAGIFDGLSALTNLYLYNNDFTTLPAGIFDELSALTNLYLHNNDFTTLPAGIFDGLSALTHLWLDQNKLRTLPAGIFDGLSALTRLWLDQNKLRTLPAGIFDELSALTHLWLDQNRLTTLPIGIFDGLSALTNLNLYRNGFTTLPAGIFDELTALRDLNLSRNALTTFPAGVFDGLTALRDLNLSSNGFTTLPAGVFDGLTALTRLNLSLNDFTTLPAGIFDGLTALRDLELSRNDFTTLPAGVFDGLTALTRLDLYTNAVDPLPLTVSLEKVADGQFKAVAPTGAPFNIVVRLTVSNGSISGGATSATISTGKLESETLTVTRTSGTTAAVTVNIGTLPSLPRTHSGYVLLKSTDLPLEIITGINTAPVFTDGTSTIRTIAENTTANTNIGTAVAATDADTGDMLTYTLGGTDAAAFSIVSTSGQLQTKAALDYETKTSYAVTITVSDGNGGSDSITVTINVTDVDDSTIDPPLSDRTPQVRDAIVAAVPGINAAADVTAAHLAAITSLGVSRKGITALKAGDFDGLTALTSLSLAYNALRSLPSGIFDNNTALTFLSFYDNNISSLPSGIFDNNTALTSLGLAHNALRSLPSGIFDNNTALTFLSFYGNNISSLPVGIFDKNTALTQLGLGYNNLSALPAGIFDKNTALRDLNFYRNNISSLPAGIFDKNTALTQLEFSDNDLSALPAGIFDKNTALGWIKLNNNDLSALPAGIFDKNTALYNLWLYNNALTSLPAGIFDNNTKLKTLNLSSNKISDVSELEGVTSLNHLLLNGNPISDYGPLRRLITAIEAIEDHPGLTLDITIPDEITNNAPVFTDGSSTTRTITENTAANTNIGTAIAATDADTGDTLTYTLSGTDAASFSIVSTSGQLQTKAALDYETKTSYSVTVSVSDSNGGADSITVTINVTDINENNAPAFANGTNTTRVIAENTAANINIGTPITATDADPGDTLTYTLSGTDAASFSIISTTGQLQTKAALDYETKTSYAITVSVSDGNGGSDTITVTINVTDVNEISAKTTYNTGDIITTLPDRDLWFPDTLTNATWRAPGGIIRVELQNGGSVEEGNFRYTCVAANGGTCVIFRRTVEQGKIEELSIPGKGTNNAPVFTDGTSTIRSIAENTAANINIGTAIAATDADTGDTLTYTLSGTDAASFSINSTTGQLQTRAALDYETKTTYTVTITVSDGSLTDTIRVTINVTDVNDTVIVPLSVPVANRTPAVRNAIVAAVPNVNSAASVTAAHLAAITSLNLRNAGITTLRADDFSGMTALTDLNLFNNQLSSLPNGIFEGLTSLTTIRLGQNAVDPLPITVTLEKVVEGRFKVVVPTGATFNYALPIRVANGSINGGATTVTIPQGSVESGILTVTRTAGTAAHVTVDIGAFPRLPTTHYGYALTKSDYLPLSVIRGINTAPVFSDGTTATRSIAENTASGVNIGAPLSATDADNDRLTYSLSGIDASTFGIISSSGQLQTRAVLDYETKASYSVTVTVSDGNGGSESITVTINITDVNENTAPIFTEGTSATRSVAENTPANTNIGTAVSATDAVNDTLTYTLGGTDAAAFSIISTSGQLQTKAALDYETKNAYSLTITVSDGSLTDTIDVTINITDINELPTATAICKVGDVLAPGESCTYPGTDAVFSVLADGSSQWNIPNLPTWLQWINQTSVSKSMRVSTTVNGQAYHFVAEQLADNSWEIKEIGDDTNQQPETPEQPGDTGETPTLTASTPAPLTEATLHEGIVTLTLNGGTYERSTWRLRDAVSVAGIAGIALDTFDTERISDRKITVKLEYDGNMTANGTLTLTLGAGAIQDYNGAALTSQISVPAVTESVTASTAAPLTETTLDESVITLTLTGRKFEGRNSTIRGAVSVSGISGVTVRNSDIDRQSDTEVTVELTFNGNLNVDGTLTLTIGADAIAGYNGPALMAQVGVAASTEAPVEPEPPEVPEPPIVTEKPVESDYDHIEGPWLWMIAPGGNIDIDNLSEASEGVITEAQIAQTGVNEGDHFNELQWTSGRLLPTTVCGIFLCSSDNVINAVREIGLTDREQLSYYSAYALINIFSPHAQNDVLMGVGSDDSIKVWLNGSAVYKNDVSRRTTGIQNQFPVNLNAGNNLLLIKVCNHAGLGFNNDWGMFFKLYLDTQDYTLSLPTGGTGGQQPQTPQQPVNTGAPPTLTVSTASPLKEATLDESVITLTLSGAKYERSIFDIRDAVSVSGISGVTVRSFDIDRQSDTVITVELTFNGNLNADGTLTLTVGADAIAGYNGPALTAQVAVSASTDTPKDTGGQNPDPPETPQQPGNTGGTATLSVSTAAPLTEATLHGNIITLNLRGATFERSSFRIRNAVSVSGIAGVSVDTFGGERISDTQATVELEYDGNMTANGTLTISLEAGGIKDYEGATLTAQIQVTAVTESVAASTAAPLKEATLDESIVTLTLSGAKYASSIWDIRDAVSVSGISGVTVRSFDIDRESDTEVTVELTYDGDMTTDGTLTLTVGPDAIAGYNGPALTAQVTVTAGDEPADAGGQNPDPPETPQQPGNQDPPQQPANTGGTPTLSVSTAVPLTEAMLHGGVITLTLSNATFERSIFWIRNAISVSGITGVDVESFGGERISNTQATIELEYDGNMAANDTLIISLEADGIQDYDGATLTAQIQVTAVTESVAASTAVPLKEATLDGSVVTLTLSGAKYESFIFDIRGNVTVSGIAGVTIPWHQPKRKSDTQITVELEFDGDMTTDGTLTFTVDADAIAGYNGPALTTQVTVTADRENALLANFPNPFNPETWIPYQLEKPTEVSITIYAIDGQLVRQLVLGHQPAGIYQNRSRAAYWDGRNAFGEPVASGVYFYTLTAGDFTATRKMLIRK